MSEIMNLNLDKLLSQLLDDNADVEKLHVDGCGQLTELKVKEIFLKARDIFLNEPTLLNLKAPIVISGNLSGAKYSDLLNIFKTTGLPPQTSYVFLGDYACMEDEDSLKKFCLLLALKIKFPENVYLLRGIIDPVFEPIQWKIRYNIDIPKEIATGWFKNLPLTAIIGQKIFCGGISPELKNLDQIKEIKRPLDEIPSKGFLRDLLRSAPDDEVSGWEEDGDDYLFGEDVIEKFLTDHDLTTMCIAGYYPGYEYFSGKRLIALIGAPFNGKYHEDGIIMTVDEGLNYSFRKPANSIPGLL